MHMAGYCWFLWEHHFKSLWKPGFLCLDQIFNNVRCLWLWSGQRDLQTQTCRQNHLSDSVIVNKAEYVFHWVVIVPNNDSLQLEKNLKFLLTDQNTYNPKKILLWSCFWFLVRLSFVIAWDLKKLFQLSISSYFILWRSFVIRYVLAPCQELKQMTIQQWLLHDEIWEAVVSYRMFNTVVFIKKLHDCKELLTRKEWKYSFQPEADLPISWGTCQMQRLPQNSSLSKTQDFVRHLFIYTSGAFPPEIFGKVKLQKWKA